VVDNDERLRLTLAHEMCHVAAWLVDGVNAPAHGPHFWKWASQVERTIPSIRVTKCHSYEINVPYKFTCTNGGCGHIYSRHSKKGIDPNRWVAGRVRYCEDQSLIFSQTCLWPLPIASAVHRSFQCRRNGLSSLSPPSPLIDQPSHTHQPKKIREANEFR
jgi:hypothetical protein